MPQRSFVATVLLALLRALYEILGPVRLLRRRGDAGWRRSSNRHRYFESA